MTRNMYTVAGDGPYNEELALRIQAGDKNAAELLISQNEGYLTKLARAYTPWCELEDVKQEAALALLMQRMEEVLTPRELNLVRSCLGIGQPNEAGMTFQELAIYLNYNGPSGAEKAYKAAEDMVGGKGAGRSVCLRGRSTDPCLRGARRSLIKKVFKSKCNKTPFPCITRMTGDRSPCSVC